MSALKWITTAKTDVPGVPILQYSINYQVDELWVALQFRIDAGMAHTQDELALEVLSPVVDSHISQQEKCPC